MMVVAQVLGGDPSFPGVNEVRWDMGADEIQSLCNRRWSAISSTDSTIVYGSSFFGAEATTKIQFDVNSRKPRMIDIAFEEPTSVMRDTLVNHFTLAAGRAPLITTKEKSLLIFTIKFEMAIWRIGRETVSVWTTTRGSSILGLNLTLSEGNMARKQNP
jgi:hypothetical protein